MAKTSMRPEVKRQKLKNNKVFKLVCSTQGCENEFLIATFNNLGQSKRKCHSCWQNPTDRKSKDRALLKSLGLVR
jgi:hypothetical protein